MLDLAKQNVFYVVQINVSSLVRTDGECVDHCQEGFFVHKESQECEPCHKDCRSCGGPRSDDCDSCEDDFTLKDGQCLDRKQLTTCPERQFKTSCVDECPKGYFNNEQEQECMQCHADCASCDGPDDKDCNVCRNPKAVRYDGECLARCPSNTYHDENNNECTACDKSCLTCSGHEPTDCLSCDANRRVDESGGCVWSSQCTMDSYVDLNGDCQRCHTQCRRCDGPGKDHCLSCNESHLLLNGTCVKKCPVGYYVEDKVDPACERCHPSCESCFGHHSQHCKTCKPGFFKQASSCVETCSERFENIKKKNFPDRFLCLLCCSLCCCSKDV
uniref:Growth factor receptor domain-containing protein n=1 Tax=Poecilia latipinna TaxID=48699 RepID=A0A3B3UMJ9_9TELE